MTNRFEKLKTLNDVFAFLCSELCSYVFNKTLKRLDLKLSDDIQNKRHNEGLNLYNELYAIYF